MIITDIRSSSWVTYVYGNRPYVVKSSVKDCLLLFSKTFIKMIKKT